MYQVAEYDNEVSLEASKEELALKHEYILSLKGFGTSHFTRGILSQNLAKQVLSWFCATIKELSQSTETFPFIPLFPGFLLPPTCSPLWVWLLQCCQYICSPKLDNDCCCVTALVSFLFFFLFLYECFYAIE